MLVEPLWITQGSLASEARNPHQPQVGPAGFLANRIQDGRPNHVFDWQRRNGQLKQCLTGSLGASFFVATSQEVHHATVVGCQPKTSTVDLRIRLIDKL